MMLSQSTVRVLSSLCVAAGLLAAPSAALAQESKPATPPAPPAPPAAKPAEAPAAGEPVALKPRFVKGDVYKYAYHIERTDTNAVSGIQPEGSGSPSSTVKVDAEMTVTVKDASDKGATLDLTVVSIQASAKAPKGESAFDSAKPEDDKDRENPAFLAFKPLVGMTLSLTTDASGVITAVGGDPAVAQGSLAPTAMQFFVNTDYLKFRWNNALVARRDAAAAKVGESWSQTDIFLAPQVGRFEQTLKHTFKSVKDGVASIDTAGDMKIFPAKEGAPLAFELKDTSILATSTWDLADGHCRSLDMQRSFTLDGSAQGLPVKRQSEEKLSITRAK